MAIWMQVRHCVGACVRRHGLPNAGPYPLFSLLSPFPLILSYCSHTPLSRPPLSALPRAPPLLSPSPLILSSHPLRSLRWFGLDAATIHPVGQCTKGARRSRNAHTLEVCRKRIGFAGLEAATPTARANQAEPTDSGPCPLDLHTGQCELHSASSTHTRPRRISYLLKEFLYWPIAS
jgi:hypothetical protein